MSARPAPRTMPARPVLAIGELLWDRFPTGDTLGGAPFNVVGHLRRSGYRALIASAVGADGPGDRALRELAVRGIETRLVSRTTDVPTAVAEVALGEDGSPSFRIPRPAAFERLSISASDRRALVADAPAAIVFGTLAQTSPTVLASTLSLTDALPGTPCVYDVNLRDGWWSFELVEQLLDRAEIVKLSDDEVRQLAPVLGGVSKGSEELSRTLARRFGLRAVAITAGDSEAALLFDGSFVAAAPPRVTVVDAVGAGDAFTAGMLDGILRGVPPADVLAGANALGAFVASRRGAQPECRPDVAERA